MLPRQLLREPVVVMPFEAVHDGGQPLEVKGSRPLRFDNLCGGNTPTVFRTEGSNTEDPKSKLRPLQPVFYSFEKPLRGAVRLHSMWSRTF